jgi:dynein heavy chain
MVRDDEKVFDDLLNANGLQGHANDVDNKYDRYIEAAGGDVNSKEWQYVGLKCFQLDQKTKLRHGCALIGLAGSMQAVIVDTVAKVNAADVERLYFSSYDPDQLYGHDRDGHWKDGILTHVMRQMSHRQGRYNHNRPKWLVLDCSLDAIRAELMNTVLDDNKHLSLANGERIPLTPDMRIIFQVENMMVCSPATVSRLGMIHCEVEKSHKHPFVSKWMNMIDPEDRKRVSELLAHFVSEEYVREWLSYVNRKDRFI